MVFLAVRPRKAARSQQECKSVITWLSHGDSEMLRGAYTGFHVMLSAIATDSDSIVKPDSEKKLVCVICGLRATFCTQNRTPRTSSFLMATRSRLTMNFSPPLTGQWTTSVINWNTWNIKTSSGKQSNSSKSDHHAWQDTIHTLYRCWRARKAALSDITYIRAAPPPAAAVHAQRLVLSPARFNFAPSGPTFVQKPTQQLVKQPERSDVIPPKLQDRSSSYPVLWLISRQRSTENKSQFLRESDRHHGETLSIGTGTNFVQWSQYASSGEKVFLINCREPRMIRHNIFFPWFYRRQWLGFPYFLQ